MQLFLIKVLYMPSKDRILLSRLSKITHDACLLYRWNVCAVHGCERMMPEEMKISRRSCPRVG